MFVRIAFAFAFVAVVVGLVARSSIGSGRERSYVVKPADTLWSIAAAHYAGDPRAGIWKLEQRNHLRGALLVPGQRLVLP